MEIKAIETVYKGYRFRSRLEARWAVFFDAMGIKYEYEKEGYDLGELGWYLPDFWLPGLKMWVEVKGKKPTKIEIEKLEVLTNKTDCFGVFISQIPFLKKNNTFEHEGYLGYWLKGEELFDEPYIFTRCKNCWTYDCKWYGRIERCDCGSCEVDYQVIRTALNSARSARFEHNEQNNESKKIKVTKDMARVIEFYRAFFTTGNKFDLDELLKNISLFDGPKPFISKADLVASLLVGYEISNESTLDKEDNN